MSRLKSKEQLRPVLINLPEDLIMRLHKKAGKKTYQTGRRVYLADLVREAIKKYLDS